MKNDADRQHSTKFVRNSGEADEITQKELTQKVRMWYTEPTFEQPKREKDGIVSFADFKHKKEIKTA